MEKVTKLLVGTKNPDKIREIRQLLAAFPVKIFTIADFPDLPDVEEPFPTIEENAITKAQAYAEFSGLPTIADDTGFFVEALAGEPGVKAARYAKENCSYKANREKVLKKMKSKSNRKAYFATVVAYYKPNGEKKTFFGKVNGEITWEEIGEKGFGYDSIFFVPKSGKTFGQMTDEEKNQMSHRSIALQKFVTFFKENINVK